MPDSRSFAFRQNLPAVRPFILGEGLLGGSGRVDWTGAPLALAGKVFLRTTPKFPERRKCVCPKLAFVSANRPTVRDLPLSRVPPYNYKSFLL